MTLFQRGAVEVRKLLRLGERDVLIADLDVNGVVTLDVSGPAAAGSIILRLEDGLSLSGIRIVDGSVELTGDYLRGLLLGIVAADTGALLVNEDAAVTAANRLAVTPAGASVGVDQRQIFLLYNTATSRWVIPNWSHFAPTDPATWDPAPTTTSEALNQLGARAPLAGTGSATWAGNTQTVWSYTLAEGEVYGGLMTLVTGHLNGATLSRSIADVSFVGSREVGGAAAVTQGTAAENGSGSLASGSVVATAVGNTIAVRLTFPSLNATAYFAWSHKPLVPPVV